MQVGRMLQSQGFGTRRACRVLVFEGRVRIHGRVVEDPSADVPVDDLCFSVDGEEWRYRERATVILHKPAGYECSREPQHHASVLELLPPPLRARGLQPVGRLDQDTTGLLLLTDDGALNHRLSSPRHAVPKTYLATLKHAAGPSLCERLLEGVQLHGEAVPFAALRCEMLHERQLRMVICEGKYHQVKRMVAAAGNRVESLHRESVGELVLPPDLAPGEWRWLDGVQS